MTFQPARTDERRDPFFIRPSVRAPRERIEDNPSLRDTDDDEEALDETASGCGFEVSSRHIHRFGVSDRHRREQLGTNVRPSSTDTRQ
jgi:hypothetical protein